jgi:hypothetical protein
MAARAASQKRNKMVFGLIAVAVVGGVAFKIISEKKKKAEAMEKLAFFEKYVSMEKAETGSFWNCVVGGEIDVGMLSSVDQIQQRVEGAYATQPKTFSDHLSTECVPKIERAISAAGSLSGAPADYGEAVTKYKGSLPKLKNGIEVYAEKIKGRAGVKDVDKLIQETGSAWTSTVDPSPEGVAFEKFLRCALPDLDKLKDVQALLELLKTNCYDKDPVAFMTKVRDECGPILTSIDKDAKPVPSKTWKATMKKFYEDGDDRMLRALDSCSRKSRKGAKKDDLEEFLVASGEYMEARNGVAEVARKIAAEASGEAPGKKEGGGEHGPAPAGKK